jgi:hypothetical protein
MSHVDILSCLYRATQEERSIFFKVTVSVILIKTCMYTCVLFGTVSEIKHLANCFE